MNKDVQSHTAIGGLAGGAHAPCSTDTTISGLNRSLLGSYKGSTDEKARIALELVLAQVSPELTTAAEAYLKAYLT